MSKIVDPKVIERVEQRGFRRDPTNPLGTRWVDEHGHVLTEIQLMSETLDGIDQLIDWLHPS